MERHSLRRRECRLRIRTRANEKAKGDEVVYDVNTRAIRVPLNDVERTKRSEQRAKRGGQLENDKRVVKLN